MPVRVSPVSGADFAVEASRILEEAWHAPALHYSPEYLRWQFMFPGSGGAGAVAAFDGGEPVGFAGFTPRRVRRGSQCLSSGIVSFVAVRPGWQGRGIAAMLYSTLLAELSSRGTPVMTFAIPNSGGKRAITRSYPEAGFQLQPLGVYPGYAGVASGKDPDCDGWNISVQAGASDLSRLVQLCAKDETVICADPDERQLHYYECDPRPRKLVLITTPSGGPGGAAWAVLSELRTRRGIETQVTLDSVFLPRRDVEALKLLLSGAALAFKHPGIVLVSAPNLWGFDAAALRPAGIRNVSAGYEGFLCLPPAVSGLAGAQGTNVEVV